MKRRTFLQALAGLLPTAAAAKAASADPEPVPLLPDGPWEPIPDARGYWLTEDLREQDLRTHPLTVTAVDPGAKSITVRSTDRHFGSGEPVYFRQFKGDAGVQLTAAQMMQHPTPRDDLARRMEQIRFLCRDGYITADEATKLTRAHLEAWAETQNPNKNRG